MRRMLSILREGTPQELELYFNTNAANYSLLNKPLEIYNLKPISYAALCGNSELVIHLISSNCTLSVENSDDCNLLTWIAISNNKLHRHTLLKYIENEKIFTKFNDGTQKIHLQAMQQLTTGSVESKNGMNQTTPIILSPLFYLLLSCEDSSDNVKTILSNINIEEILLLPNDIDIKNPIRIARYYYILAYYLYRHQFYELSILFYRHAINFYQKSLSESSSYYRELSYVYNSLGNTYYNHSDWNNAIQSYEKAVITHSKITETLLIDHQNLTNYRSNLAGYMQDETDDILFNHFADI